MTQDWMTHSNAMTVQRHETGARPAWLWDFAGENLLWQNEAAQLLGAKIDGDTVVKLGTAQPIKGQISRLMRMGITGHPTLSRVQFIIGRKPFAATCKCTILDFDLDAPCMLIVGVEPIADEIWAIVHAGRETEAVEAAQGISSAIAKSSHDNADILPPMVIEAEPEARVMAQNIPEEAASEELETALDDVSTEETVIVVATPEPEFLPKVKSAEVAKDQSESPVRNSLATIIQRLAEQKPMAQDRSITEGAAEQRFDIASKGRKKELSLADIARDFAILEQASREIEELDKQAQNIAAVEPEVETEELEQESQVELIADAETEAAEAAVELRTLEAIAEIAADTEVARNAPDVVEATPTEASVFETAAEVEDDHAPLDLSEQQMRDIISEAELAEFSSDADTEAEELSGQQDIDVEAAKVSMHQAIAELEALQDLDTVAAQAIIADGETTATEPKSYVHFDADETVTHEDAQAGLASSETAQPLSEKQTKYNFAELAQILADRVGRVEEKSRSKPSSVYPLSDETLVLNRLPLGLLIFRDEDVLFVNRSLVTMIGFTSAEEVKALGLAQILPQSEQAGTAAPFSKLRTKDGNALNVKARLQTISWQGRSAFMLSAQPLELDNTPKPYEPLLARNVVVEAEPPKADDKLRGLPLASLSRISRELRRPTNTIVGFSELIATEAFGPVENPRYVEYAKDINSAGNEIADLTDELDDFVRYSSEGRVVSPSKVDLAEALADCLRRVRGHAGMRRVLLRSSISSKLPIVIIDETTLKQAVMNMLASAINDAREGTKVILSAQRDDDGAVLIHVRDAAKGPEDLAEQFVVFRDGMGKNGALRRPVKSSIGLTLTRSLVAVNACAFDLAPVNDTGTLMTLTIPAKLVVKTKPKTK